MTGAATILIMSESVCALVILPASSVAVTTSTLLSDVLNPVPSGWTYVTGTGKITHTRTDSIVTYDYARPSPDSYTISGRSAVVQ